MATTQPSPGSRTISLHQTFLRFSIHNFSTRPHRSKMQRGAFILKLPDEILLPVLELATTNPRLSEEHCHCETLLDYADLKSLLFTCRRFSRIVLPWLYHTIRFDYPHQMVRPTRAAKSLHRSLQENPSLLQHCRVLRIDTNGYLAGTIPADFSIANDFVSWFKRVRCLEVYGEFAKIHIWPCIQTAVRHMPEIEHIAISGRWLDLESIMQNVDIPTLRKLTINGFSDKSERSTNLQSKVLPLFRESSVLYP